MWVLKERRENNVAKQVSRGVSGMKQSYRLAGPDNARFCRSLDSSVSAREATEGQSQGGNELICVLEIPFWLLDEGQICIQEWKPGVQMEVVAFRGTKVPWGEKVINDRNILSKYIQEPEDKGLLHKLTIV